MVTTESRTAATTSVRSGAGAALALDAAATATARAHRPGRTDGFERERTGDERGRAAGRERRREQDDGRDTDHAATEGPTPSRRSSVGRDAEATGVAGTFQAAGAAGVTGTTGATGRRGSN